MAMVAAARPVAMAKAAAAPKPSNAYARWKKKLDSLDPDSEKYKSHLAAGVLKGYGKKGEVKRMARRLAFAHRTTALAQTLQPGPPRPAAPTASASAAAAPSPSSSPQA